MKINRSDADKWYLDFEELNTEEQYKYVIETLEGEITHKFKEELDLNDILLELVEEMYHNKKFEDMIRLYNVIDSKNIMDEEFHYIELFMVKYHLRIGKVENIDAYLKKSKENPVKAIDGLCEIVSDLCRYGKSKRAVEVSKVVYEPVRDAEDIIDGVELEFGEIIALDSMEKLCGLKENNQELDRCLEEIEYYFGWDKMIMRSYTEYLNSDIDHNIYDLKLDEALKRIWCGFQRYMIQRKGINFNVSSDIWFKNTEHIEMNEISGGNFDGIFKLNKASLFESIAARFNDFLSDKSQNYVNVFGLFYMYDYLFEAGLISEKLYRETIQLAEVLKLKIIKVAGENLWKVNFVYTWEAADSMDRYEFELEKEYSWKTLEGNIDLEDNMPKWYNERIHSADRELEKILRQSEIEENKKKVVTKEKTAGRNDKCPCGSGKKYKKCCGKM